MAEKRERNMVEYSQYGILFSNKNESIHTHKRANLKNTDAKEPDTKEYVQFDSTQRKD